MADPSTCPALIPSSIGKAHALIQPYVHRTPLLTCQTLDRIASSPDPRSVDVPRQENNGNTDHPAPKLRLFFKCENLQKIGAFKARGAHHALLRLTKEMGIDEVRRRGVVTHSSGNHAQALALAASTFKIPAYIVMPTISTPSKIKGTKFYTDKVIFSGSTSQEREAKVAEVIEQTGAVLVPPYDHPDIVLGQGTVGLEMAEQYDELVEGTAKVNGGVNGGVDGESTGKRHLNAVMVPLGGGGLLGGIATHFSQPTSPQQKTCVFGAEPSYQDCDDARRGLAAQPPKRIERVSSLTIADGLRTPVGILNWGIISDKRRVEGVYAVSEDEIKSAMRLVMERMKVVVEPSAVVGLAVVLYNQEWRQWAVERQREEGAEERGWDVGIVFSGGNTTMEAVMGLFGKQDEDKAEKRAEGKIGVDGKTTAENIAG